jgi:hypothetical protein
MASVSGTYTARGSASQVDATVTKKKAGAET